LKLLAKFADCKSFRCNDPLELNATLRYLKIENYVLDSLKFLNLGFAKIGEFYDFSKINAKIKIVKITIMIIIII